MLESILKWPLIAYDELLGGPMAARAAVLGALAVGYYWGGVPSLDEGVMPLATQYLVTGTALLGLNMIVVKVADSSAAVQPKPHVSSTQY